MVMARSDYPVIAPSLLTNINIQKWVDTDLFNLGSPANEFMQNEEDEIALVEAVVDYEMLESKKSDQLFLKHSPFRTNQVLCSLMSWYTKCLKVLASVVNY